MARKAPDKATAPGGPRQADGHAKPAPKRAEGHPSEPAVEELAAQLEDARRERDEYLELAQRTKAEFENFRKRLAGSAAEAELRGQAQIARQLLPVLDNLERALAAAEPRDDETAASPLAEGVRLVHAELEGVLRRTGVESYEPAGEQFDPEWHEAVMMRTDEQARAGTVVEVTEKGYKLNGAVLRPAKVVVAKEPAEAEGDGE